MGRNTRCSKDVVVVSATRWHRRCALCCVLVVVATLHYCGATWDNHAERMLRQPRHADPALCATTSGEDMDSLSSCSDGHCGDDGKGSAGNVAGDIDLHP